MGRWNKPDLPEPPGGWRKGEKAAEHARLRALDAEQREARIERIATMHASGSWHGSFSAKSLADEWKCSIFNVYRLGQMASARASHGVSQEKREAKRAVAIARTETLSFLAQQKGDHRTALEAEVASAKLSGISMTPIEHLLRFEDPATEQLIHRGPQVAVEAALAHLVEHTDDWEGARIAGTEAAEKQAVKTVVEMGKQADGQLRDDLRSVLAEVFVVAGSVGVDVERFRALLAARLRHVGPVETVALPQALSPGERFGLLVEATSLAMPENDDDVAPWRPVLAELAGGGRDEEDAAE